MNKIYVSNENKASFLFTLTTDQQVKEKLGSECTK